MHISTARLPLTGVKQLAFKIKNRVLAKSRFRMVYNAQEQEKILKEVFGEMRMNQVHRPK